VTDSEHDAVAAFRARLKRLHQELRSPTYSSLEKHASLEGEALATSTISERLKGPNGSRTGLFW
jgi:hypothetical protein